MQYELDCECGAYLLVEETAAGTTALCDCGRKVAVPSLRQLRRRAGVVEPAVSPELAVESLLLAGKLPEENYCVLCRVTTDQCISCRTECERAHVESAGPSLGAYLLAFLTFGLFGVAVARSTAGEGTEWGKDRIFSLPLRVCEGCRPGLANSEALKAALCRVPLYQRLLEKYPDAQVSLPVS